MKNLRLFNTLKKIYNSFFTQNFIIIKLIISFCTIIIINIFNGDVSILAEENIDNENIDNENPSNENKNKNLYYKNILIFAIFIIVIYYMIKNDPSNDSTLTPQQKAEFIAHYLTSLSPEESDQLRNIIRYLQRNVP